jgi:hypothetical protein
MFKLIIQAVIETARTSQPDDSSIILNLLYNKQLIFTILVRHRSYYGY